MADAEAVFVAWLEQEFTDARICTETPANLDDALPCIQVTRIGGGDEEVSTFDNPRMDFDCYAATRSAARDLAYAVRASIRNDLPGETIGGAFASRVSSSTGPSWAPHTNTNLRRFVYSAQIRLHSLEA